MTELDAATGALVQVISGSSYGFNYRRRLLRRHPRLGRQRRRNSVTELDAATGALVQVFRAPATGSTIPPVSPPTAPTCGWPTRMHWRHRAGRRDRRTGPGDLRLRRRVQLSRRGLLRRHPRLGAPTSADSVTELDAATGALVQVLTGSRYGFNQRAAVSSDGTDVWVTNPGDESVTGFPASTG